MICFFFGPLCKKKEKEKEQDGWLRLFLFFVDFLIESEVDNFVTRLANNHSRDCGWKENECDKSFEYLANTIEMKEELMFNINSWNQTDSNGNYYLPKEIDISRKQQMLQTITPLPMTDDEDDNDNSNNTNTNNNNENDCHTATWQSFPNATVL